MQEINAREDFIIDSVGETDGSLFNIKRIPVKQRRASCCIGIYFPYSYDSPKHPFVLSFNVARNSRFLQGLLDNVSEDIVYFEVIIPDTLYHGIRYVDIEHFIRLWEGSRTFYEHEKDKYCYQSLAILCASLLVNQKYYFVQWLEKRYEPNGDPKTSHMINI